VPTPGYGRQALQAWSAPTRDSIAARSIAVPTDKRDRHLRDQRLLIPFVAHGPLPGFERPRRWTSPVCFGAPTHRDGTSFQTRSTGDAGPGRTIGFQPVGRWTWSSRKIVNHRPRYFKTIRCPMRLPRRGYFPQPWVAASAATLGYGPKNPTCTL
jgi:hypothetical protein